MPIVLSSTLFKLICPKWGSSWAVLFLNCGRMACLFRINCGQQVLNGQISGVPRANYPLGKIKETKEIKTKRHIILMIE